MKNLLKLAFPTFALSALLYSTDAIADTHIKICPSGLFQFYAGKPIDPTVFGFQVENKYRASLRPDSELPAFCAPLFSHNRIGYYALTSAAYVDVFPTDYEKSKSEEKRVISYYLGYSPDSQSAARSESLKHCRFFNTPSQLQSIGEKHTNPIKQYTQPCNVIQEWDDQVGVKPDRRAVGAWNQQFQLAKFELYRYNAQTRRQLNEEFAKGRLIRR